MKDALDVTPAEFSLLEILWSAEGELSVGQVLEAVAESRGLAYTTVMTLLDKLARKGTVRRRKEGKAYLYKPDVEREAVLRFAVTLLSNQYFGGDPARLRDFLDTSPKAEPEHPAEPPPEPELDVSLL